MKIYYGIFNNLIEITDICYKKLTFNNIISIPNGDVNRSRIFTDPLPGIHKKIFIEINQIINIYDEFHTIKINTLTNNINTINDNDINNKIINIHFSLNIKYGRLDEELPEQKMVVRYLTGNESVLEIGGNIGRNSLIIASILKNNKNFVVLECDINISNQLIENRDLNNFNFNVECAALSNRKLIQKGWDTIPSDVLLDGYNWVNTITLKDLKLKYNIKFDTLVLDCEGAFYYILMDMPEILNNINLIIMENDYFDISKKNFVDQILIKNKFYIDYNESGGWGPCYDSFFQVWKKMN
jgi:FkbM family methyltransferase